MRARVILLLVGAVVFAPGWDADARLTTPGGSADLARILAPTFDEASAQRRAKEVSIEQIDGRHSEVEEVHASYVGVVQSSGSTHPLIALLALIALSSLTLQFADRDTRAPPSFLLS